MKFGWSGVGFDMSNVGSVSSRGFENARRGWHRIKDLSGWEGWSCGRH